MKEQVTDVLCTECGLCCDGSLFDDVELAGEKEISGLEVLGLEIEEAEDDVHGLLVQPCGALKGKRCTFYAHRPSCCRTFECRLLQQVKRGEIPINRAKETISKTLSQVQAIKGLIGQLCGKHDDERLPLKERFAEALALSEESRTGPEQHQIRGQLESAMRCLEKVMHGTFLGL